MGAISHTSSLSSKERTALDAAGVKAGPKTKSKPLAAGTLERKSIIDTSCTTEEVATYLGVSVGRIRQRVQEGTLFLLRVDGEKSRVFPSWQFTEDGEVPGLKTVLKALSRDLNMQDVFGFFTTPQPDLEDSPWHCWIGCLGTETHLKFRSSPKTFSTRSATLTELGARIQGSE